MNCEKCQGKGYNKEIFLRGSLAQSVKVFCEECHGTGQVQPELDRSGIAWERE